MKEAANRLDAECPGWRERGRLKVGDITRVDLGKNLFNAVIDNECVYCLSFDMSREIYDKAKDALKIGGKLFVRTFAAETWGL